MVGAVEIPSQCPECRRISIAIREVPPGEHDRGEQWCTQAECDVCGEYVQWFEDGR
ncbi:hypothetical protein [Haloarcula onubensis]|uniref:Small CPxCG-related zinc finger protein n=1 Tax=Haloarcula onubensis TaxID=2950539 RepID=A0ABU2FJ70_9EURY|nr:hypothetical protein [Halomicroarcula sp. S3CR25-11]MDS0280799.1 hypothetical protein [Halomicroarcula sp. S3CR25-11]